MTTDYSHITENIRNYAGISGGWLQVAPQRGRTLPDKEIWERVLTSISRGIKAEDKTEMFLFSAQETRDQLSEEFVKRWLIKSEAS